MSRGCPVPVYAFWAQTGRALRRGSHLINTRIDTFEWRDSRARIRRGDEFAMNTKPRRTFFHPFTLALSSVLHSQSAGMQPASSAARLSEHWEELTASDFREGIRRSQGTCLLPFGILEKHGPHLPLGTDLLDVRYAALHAAEEEYAVVFPEYYFGQIAEAKHEPGTMAYSRNLQLALLQETTDEMARNGCKKVLIVNGHGGNEHLLPYFAQSQLDKSHDYVVYVFDERTLQHGGPAKQDRHRYARRRESETSKMMISRPDTVRLDRATKRIRRRSGPHRSFPKVSTLESGGTLVFPTTTPATVQLPPKNLASIR